MRKCSICEEEKEESEYYRRNATELRNDCRQCIRARHKKWRDDNPGINRKYYDKSYEKNRHRYCDHCGQRYRRSGSSVRFCRLDCYLKGNYKKNSNECWEWQGTLDKNGYGRAKIDKKNMGVHRLSYMNFIGEIPKEFLVCHRCDNPKCINPDHLFVGTVKDNTLDMYRKGRGRWSKKITGNILNSGAI